MGLKSKQRISFFFKKLEDDEPKTDQAHRIDIVWKQSSFTVMWPPLHTNGKHIHMTHVCDDSDGFQAET